MKDARVRWLEPLWYPRLSNLWSKRSKTNAKYGPELVWSCASSLSQSNQQIQSSNAALMAEAAELERLEKAEVFHFSLLMPSLLMTSGCCGSSHQSRAR